jgi:hypothetical protein
MYFGGDGVPPLRIRDMESTADLSFVDGVADLPDDYLDKRDLYWEGSQTISVSYEPPSVFYPLEKSRAGVPYPLGYTVEGSLIKVSGSLNGTGKLLHYTKAPTLDDDGEPTGEPLTQDGDTNVILQKFPGVYLYGVQIEIYRMTRDAEQANALQRYGDAVQAANTYALVSRSHGGPMRRRVGFAGI